MLLQGIFHEYEPQPSPTVRQTKIYQQIRAKIYQQIRAKQYVLTLKCDSPHEFETWVDVLGQKCESMYDSEKSITAGTTEVDDGDDFTAEEKAQAARYEAQLKAAQAAARQSPEGGSDSDDDASAMPTGHSDGSSEVMSNAMAGSNPLAGGNPLAGSTPATPTGRESMGSPRMSMGFSAHEAETFGITLGGPIVFKALPTKTYTPCASQQFRAVLQGIEDASSNKERLSSLCLSLQDEITFTCAQVKSILDSTTSVKTKLAMIELMAPRLSDPKAAVILSEEFKYATERSQVESIIKQRVAQLDLFASSASVSPVQASRREFSGGRGGGGGGGRGGGGGGGGRGGGATRSSLGSPSSVDRSPTGAHKPKVICSGFLFKKSKFWGEWRKRFISITNPAPGEVRFHWYLPRDQVNELGSFSLPEATFKRTDDEVFKLVSSGAEGKVKELSMKSPSKSTIQKWCNTIEVIYNEGASASWLQSDEEVPPHVAFKL